MKKHLSRATASAVSASLFALSACATHPDSIGARYVSPVAYHGYDCNQLGDERNRLRNEVDRVAGLQRENANGDAVMMTVGLVIFWPALIGMAATKDRGDELGRLKGEYDAVDAQMRMKQCQMPIPGVVPAQPDFAPALAQAQPPATLPAASAPPLPAEPQPVRSVAPPPATRRNLGLEVLPMVASNTNPDPQGVIVVDVQPGGAAATGGLRRNDVILSFDQTRIANVDDLRLALGRVAAGSAVPVTVLRDQRQQVASLAF